jgi:hypothetical protein
MGLPVPIRCASTSTLSFAIVLTEAISAKLLIASKECLFHRRLLKQNAADFVFIRAIQRDNAMLI